MCILRLEVRQRQKDFFEAASTFFQIAEIEHTHQERFQKIAEMLENGTYYSPGRTRTVDLYKLRLYP